MNDFTTEQKLAALQRAVDDAREYERKTRPGYLCLPEQIDRLLAIVADYETRIPALVKASEQAQPAISITMFPNWARELKAALRHFQSP